MKREINVYVIELEQPFKNWYGILKSYDLKKRVCTIENDKEEDVEVRMTEVYETDSNLSLEKFLQLNPLHKPE